MSSASEIYEVWKVAKPVHPNSTNNSNSSDSAVTSESKQVKKRVRTGCFNCRRKHKKCDEQKPICKSCSVKKESCEWPNLNEPKKKNNRQIKKKLKENGTLLSQQESQIKQIYNQQQQLQQLPSQQRQQYQQQQQQLPHSPRKSPLSKGNNSQDSEEDDPEDDEVDGPLTMKPTQKRDSIALENYTKHLETIDNSLNSTAISEPLRSNNDQYSSSGLTSQQLQNNNGSQKTLTTTATPSLFTADHHSAPFNNNQQNVNTQLLHSIHHQSTTSGPSSSISPGSSSGIPSVPQVPNTPGGGPGGAPGSDFNFLMSPSMETDFGIIDYNDPQSALRDYMFANATHFQSSTDIFNPNLLNDERLSVTSEDPVSFLTKKEEKLLVKNYLYNVSPWLDMFDLSRQMGLRSVQLAKKSSSLRYAILSLSAKQIEKTDVTYNRTKSNILYQCALKHLIPSVKKSPSIGAISACVMLCVLDMMSTSPEKWRYHLEGCSALFKATGINGFSEQYERALFWVFARMDVNSAVIGEQSTMIECEKWLPEGSSIYEAGELFKQEGSYEMYANYMVFLCSRVMNLISSENDVNFDKEWELLWNEVNQWHKERPDVMRVIFEFESSPFPEVLYDNGPAISSNQLYHMAMILLMENKPRLFKINPKQVKPPTWHAKQICAISIHNDHHGCWNNSVQTLWIAGRLLTHEDEHRIILDLLNRIEATTGWGMKFRARDLIEFWGQA